MARIPDLEIERLKAEVSIPRLVEASGVVLKRVGKDWFGRCPFHADETASLSISSAKNLWHCLGACQTGGSAIDWVMRAQGVSFRHAVELLRADLPLAASAPVKQSTVRKLPAPVTADADDRAALRQVIAYDRDEAGDKAAVKLTDKLTAEGIDCYRIQFLKGMDANDYALKVQPAAKSLGLVIRKAVWLGKGQAKARPEAEPRPSMPAAPADPEPEPFSSPGSESGTSLAADAAPETPALPALPASPIPAAPTPEPAAEITDSEVVLTFGDLRYRVRGLPKNLACDSLKVNLLVARGEAFHVDSLDLYSARARTGFVSQAAAELHVKDEILKADLGRVLLKLEALQEEQIRTALEVKPAGVELTAPEREAALALLKSPDLLDRLLADFDTCGLIGERTNKLTAYLAAVSRKLDKPLAVVVQSSSAAGKSSLMDAVLAFVPEEERIKYSAMTGQSLFYMGQTNLKHKILAIVEEEGASRASYALKLLQSEGELTIASTGKDPATGNLVTQEYRVEGPVMIFFTTTAIEIDEELLNRCLVLSVDEGREQTQAIHRLQRTRRTLEGLQARQKREHLMTLHQNAQRLLRPLAVVNPYADQLTFLDDRTRTRRDHEKYLTLIDALALLHQHQRPVQSTLRRGEAIEYVEVTLDDIAHANALAHEVLGRSTDELPPQTRRLLQRLCAWVAERASAEALRRADFRFSRRDVREATGWGDTQLRIHLDCLVQLEYLLVHRGSRGQSFVYELLYDGDGDAKPHLSGLIDTATLATSRGATGQNAGSSRVQSGVNAGPSRDIEVAEKPDATRLCAETTSPAAESHVLRSNGRAGSYPQALAAAGR